MLLPTEYLHDKLFSVDTLAKPNHFEDGKEYSTPYSDAMFHFTSTYDSEN